MSTTKCGDEEMEDETVDQACIKEPADELGIQHLTRLTWDEVLHADSMLIKVWDAFTVAQTIAENHDLKPLLPWSMHTKKKQYNDMGS